MRRRTTGSIVGGATILATALVLFSNASALAVDRVKANNATNLDQGASWVGGVVPNFGDVGVWNNTVTGANAAALGSDQSWSGIRIVNPGGAVTINAGNTLTLGASGINLSAATQNLTIASGLTLLGDTKQTWTVGAGRQLTVSGALTQSAGAGVHFNLAAGGVINLSSVPTPPAILRYGVVTNAAGIDAAAVNASGNVVGVGEVHTYNIIPDAAGGLPNYNNEGTGAVLARNGFDVVTLNTNATSAFRLANTLTINAFGVVSPAPLDAGQTSTGVIRFNTEWNDTVETRDWTVDLASNRVLSWTDHNPVIIMTANTGASDVIFNGSGHLRATTGSGTFWLHQYNPNSDMIFNNTNGLSQANGAQQLHKDGVGRVIIATDGSNYTGATHIAEGSLQIGNGGTVGNLNATSNVINNASLRFSRSNAFTFGNNISGGGSVTVANVGTGEVTLSGTNTYLGATFLEGGFVNLTALDDIGNAAAPLIFNGGGVKHGAVVDISTKNTTFQANGALVNTDGKNVTYAGAVGGGGAGGLTKNGLGILSLGGANTYAGLTRVNEGTLRVNGSVVGGALAASGGTIGGSGTITGNTTVNSGGTLAPGASVGTLTTTSLTLDAGSLLNFEFNASSNDRVVTTGANGLTINGGAVSLFQENSAGAFADPGTYTLMQFAGALQGVGVSALSIANPEPAFNYVFGVSGNNVTVTLTSTNTIGNWLINGGGSWNTAANWSSNPTVPNSAGASARFTTQLAAPATVTLDGGKTVGGVSFSSNNGYTIAAGSGGSLTFSTGIASAAQLNASAGNHTISAGVQLTSSVLAQVSTGASITISGAIGGAGGITKEAGGTLILGNAANNYSGTTTVRNGVVQFAAAGSLGSGAVSLDGGTLRYAGGNTADISSKTVTLAAGGGTIDTNGNNVTYANAIGNNGAGSLTKAGAGRLALLGNNTYSGATNITGGTLAITANGQLGVPTTGAAVNISNGATLESSGALVDLDADGIGTNARPMAIGTGGGVVRVTGVDTDTLTVRGVVSGAGSLTKVGPGTLTMTAANTYAGGTNVQEGTLVAATAGGLGSGPITLSGTAVLDNGDTTLPGPLTVSGTPTLRGGGGTNHGVAALNGSGTLNIEVTGGVFDFEGDISGFNGVINMTNVAGGGGRFFGSNGNAPNITFNLTGVSLANRGNSQQINLGGLSGDALSGLSGAADANTQTNFNIGGKNETSEFMGAIVDGTGPTNVNKVGTGTLTLSGLNTYTGNTTVTAGTLSVTQANVLSDTGDVFLLPGATLNLNNGSQIDVIDSLFINGIMRRPGIYGAASLGGTPLAQITGNGAVQVTTFVLQGDFDGNGKVEAADLTTWRGVAMTAVATADADFDGDSDGADFAIWQRQLGQQFPVTPATGAVPEPGSCALMLVAAAAFVAGRRRKTV